MVTKSLPKIHHTPGLGGKTKRTKANKQSSKPEKATERFLG